MHVVYNSREARPFKKVLLSSVLRILEQFSKRISTPIESSLPHDWWWRHGRNHMVFLNFTDDECPVEIT